MDQLFDFYIKNNKKTIEDDVILHNKDDEYSTSFNRNITIMGNYFFLMPLCYSNV